jgi:L-ascorbate metabolism protein UlaG (beta-lactamase superfamily)
MSPIIHFALSTALLCISYTSRSQNPTVTYLANEGVMLEYNDVKVLIDPFFKEDFKVYQKLPIKDLNQYLDEHKELDNADAILISHRHADHFYARWIADYMKRSSRTLLLSSEQVTDSVQYFYPSSKNRSINFELEVNEESVVHATTNPNLRFKVWWFRHGYWRNHFIVNLCFLVEIGGKKIMHLGDADSDADNFEDVDLAKEKIDLLLVPVWFLQSEEGLSIIKKINPARVGAIHMSNDNSTNKSQILKSFPKTTFFDKLFMKVEVE